MTNPIRLFLLRHGNTFETGQTPVQIGAKTDLPLTKRGREQAAAFAQFMTQLPTPAAIYAGSLKRQIETAQIVAQALHAENRLHVNEEALTEIDYGAWEGLASEEITLGWPEEYSAWTTAATWPHHLFGSSLEWHLASLNHWLDSLRAQYASGDIVVGISSNGTIRLFYSFLEEEWKRLQREKKIETLKVKTGHFCELALYEKGLKVLRWGCSVD